MKRITNNLRPNQETILAYEKGMMGISAVPGSGKTWTLSLLAAQLLARNLINDDQEILIVTLVNSAVDNFYQRIRGFLKQYHQFPFGYRVRTLHGLAHDIVKERPELLGLDNNFQIIDERESALIRNDAAQSWLRSNPNALDMYLDPKLEDYQVRRIRRYALVELIQEIALVFTRSAKNQRLNPDYMIDKMSSAHIQLPLAKMGVEIYAAYQRALMYRGAVDFDDLIRLAIRALELDSDLLERLRYRWPYILEDEAQDSSLLQEQILRKLVGLHGNWVRVGDPNQAIYETFTTASPKYLREFIREPSVESEELPYSGRSTKSVINIANYLVYWTQNLHPVQEVRDALQSPPLIQPTPEGDPQPNPPDNPSQIYLVTKNFKPDQEIEAVVASIKNWLPSNSNRTVGVLVPRNSRADQMVDALDKNGIPYNDSLLRISSRTRSAAEYIYLVLNYLADPLSTQKLAEIYKITEKKNTDGEDLQHITAQVTEAILKNPRVEDYLWPSLEHDMLREKENMDPRVIQELTSFRRLITRWQKSVILPIDQIVLTFSQDLFSEAGDLAVAQKIAVLLKQASENHPDWRMSDFVQEINLIIHNQRRLLGFSEDDLGFDPDKHRGVVVVTTMHSAKGLEWDRVYLLSVNNYDFPGDPHNDQFISEKWFIRDNINLHAESLAQLQTLLSTEEFDWYEEKNETFNSRLDYIRERLRLLYVGITRAKRELIITWNIGHKGDLKPAISLISVQDFWQSQNHNLIN